MKITPPLVFDILWLWPDILNLHGDRGNAMALERIAGMYGIEARITRVNRLTDDFDPLASDLILMNPGELVNVPHIVDALSMKKYALETYAAEGGALLCIGTTGAALANRTERTNGSAITGLGLLDMTCRERTAVLGDDLIARAFGETVYGIQIQMMDTILNAGQEPFAELVYGYGNNGGGSSGAEGAASGNIIFTNMLGPVLVKNPWLTLELIRRALGRRHADRADEIRELLTFDPARFELELRSTEAIRRFNTTKEKPIYK
ncbi:MAG: cobalamin biosynthesis protein CobQ [Clostridiales Family XIII bacterium]|jgi:CobQ-like glutamine amidotransferase family enzyme|nr:cobalamin biosynthesis protein CobQ [Clostridiales Family XIII bacterium]